MWPNGLKTLITSCMSILLKRSLATEAANDPPFPSFPFIPCGASDGKTENQRTGVPINFAGDFLENG